MDTPNTIYTNNPDTITHKIDIVSDITSYKSTHLFQKYAFDNLLIPVIKRFFAEEFHYDGELDELHTLLSKCDLNETDKEYFTHLSILLKTDRNNVFINKFHKYIDIHYEFNYLYLKFMTEYVKPIFHNRPIVVQKTPNIRISFPHLTAIGKFENDDNMNIIGLHRDNDFGHIKDEINIIIPITKMFETNSIFHEVELNSTEPVEYYTSLCLQETEFFRGYFNQIRHYNKINLTEKTRISFDARVVLYEDYLTHLDEIKNTKFELGKYFVLL